MELNGGGIRINGFYGIGFDDEPYNNNTPNGIEGAKIYFDNTLTANPNTDILIIEKKDGSSVVPDGAIAFTNRGNNGIRSVSMFINGNGNIGIGTIAPSAMLSVNGSADKIGGGTWATFSDRRVKTNIKPFTDGLDLLMKLHPVSYKFNEKSGYADLNKTFIGFIAQDVEEIAPYMVSTYDDTEGPSGLKDKRQFDESALSKIMLNAIQEQQRMIEEQQKMIKEQQKLIDSFRQVNENQQNAIEKLSIEIEQLKNHKP